MNLELSERAPGGPLTQFNGQLAQELLSLTPRFYLIAGGREIDVSAERERAQGMDEL